MYLSQSSILYSYSRNTELNRIKCTCKDDVIINQIQLWYSNENTISAIQFIQQSGIESNIYGISTNNSEIIESETNSNNWIFAGYSTSLDSVRVFTSSEIAFLGKLDRF